MPIANRTTWLPELKDYYHDEMTKNLVYEGNPLLAVMPKRTDWRGANWELPIQHGVVQGLGADFATAQANKRASKHKRFSIPLFKYYALADVDNSLMDTALGTGTFMEALTTEIDGAFRQFGNDMSMALFGDGTGRRGAIVSGGGTTTWTVAASDIVNFECGMFLTYGATAAAASGVTAVEVTAVDRNLNTVEVSAAGTAIDTDLIFRDGDEDARIQGLDAWLLDPTDAGYAAALAASFNGVTRSVDPTRLAGNFYDGSADTVEDAIINAGARASREGANGVRFVVMNPIRVAELDRLLESGSNHRSRFEKMEGADGVIGFESLKFHTPAGLLDVISDRNCPENVAYMLDPRTWSLRSAGTFGKFLQHGAFDEGILRNSASDSIEFRIGGYGALGCSAPGKNVRVKLA